MSAGFLVKEDTGYVDRGAEPDPHVLTALDELVERIPALAPHVRLGKACLEALEGILTGSTDPVSVMFPNGSVELVEGIYRGHPLAEHYNALLIADVERFVLEANRPISILEIGGGTGGTSRALIERLATLVAKVEYTFTDISAAFTKRARNSFGARYSFVSFRTLDIEADPASQGFSRESYDIVFATNALHATRDMRRTLAQAASMLRPGGLFLANEVTRRQAFTTLTFGITKGWWLYRDPELRIPHSPLVDASTWTLLLGELGFEGMRALSAPGEAGSHHVISAIWPVTKAARAPEPLLTEQPAEPRDLTAETIAWISATLGEVLEQPIARGAEDEQFEALGVDSLISQAILAPLGRVVGKLPATLLFEHTTPRRLAEFFVSSFSSRLTEHFARTRPHQALVALQAPAPVAIPAPVALPPPPVALAAPVPPTMPQPAPAVVEVRRAGARMPIAIVGLAGRFPGADDVETFWENLLAGRSSITEVPAERWDHGRIFAPSSKTPGTTRSRWGGFLSDVDRFDTYFFQMTPRDAELADPQERLFLETAYGALENAGYGRRRLKRLAHDVGVFVGVMNGMYSWYAAEATAQGHYTRADSNFWSVANRVSFALDLKGPSLAVDTACSSSLTAIHLACEAIRRGECRAAIAGGVNLILHPRQYQRLSELRMLAGDERCKAFGANADGFVDGEGVAAVLLRPLDEALRDGDRIEGVILGSALNAGGKTGGFMVPSPGAQADVVRRAFEHAGIEPSTISYIEAHGTGTHLGDPIEIRGLELAFQGAVSRCPVGSVKSNIGHLESAAGVSSLIKVLQQLRHRTLAPSLHATPPNPQIDFEHSSFFVVQEPTEWMRPQAGVPLRAGVSSFGAGGANAHLIVEEAPPANVRPTLRPDRWLVLVSAPSAHQLEHLLRALSAHIERNPRLDIADVSRTLNVGRDAFSTRAAFMARDVAELRAAFEAVLSSSEHPARRSAAAPAAPGDDALWAGHAAAFLRGEDVDLEAVHDRLAGAMVSLPGTVLARERYWPAAFILRASTPEPTTPANVTKHDFVSVTLRAEDVAASEHLLEGRPVVAGAFLVELLCRVVREQRGFDPSVIEDLHFVAPLTFSEPSRRIDVELTGNDQPVEAWASSEGNVLVRAKLSKERATPRARREELETLRSNAPLTLARQQLDARFRAQGFSYGPAFATLQRAFIHQNAVLGALVPQVPGDQAWIDPLLLDGAWQAASLLGSSELMRIPVGVERLGIHRKLTGLGFVIAQRRVDNGSFAKFDLAIVNDKGEAVVEISGYSVRTLERGDAKGPPGRLSTSTHEWTARHRVPAYPPNATSLRVHGFPATDQARLLQAFAEGPSGAGTLKTVSLLVDGRLRTHGDTFHVVTRLLSLVRELVREGVRRALILTLVDDPTVRAAAGGFARSLALEHPGFEVRALEADASCELEKLVADELSLGPASLHEVRVTAMNTAERVAVELPLSKRSTPPPQGGVYLVTGGVGHVGGILAGWLAATRGAQVVLLGRSEPGEKVHRALEALRSSGGRVEYQRADVTSRADVERAVAEARRLGPVRGVVHAAGIVDDALVLHTEPDRARRVWEPKVTGFIHLDEATATDPIDLFLVCSSVTASEGNVGQSIYGAANSALVELCARRDEARRAGHRRGTTLAVEWPLWAGSSLASPAQVARLSQLRGVVPLEPQEALDVLERSAGGPTSHIILQKLRTGGPERPAEQPPTVTPAPVAAKPTESQLPALERHLTRIIARHTRVDEQRLGVDTSFQDLGIESLVVMEVTEELERTLGRMPRTLLYEFDTVARLARHLSEEHAAAVSTWMKASSAETVAAPPPSTPSETPGERAAVAPVRPAPAKTRPESSDEPIAIIGVAGRYPDAPDLRTYWKNLVGRRDSIREVPRERWNHDEYYDLESGKPGKTYGKWGGFLDGHDAFDALFFSISPREAEFIDPQERQFLEVAYESLEDAALPPPLLRGKKVGCFVGVMYGPYQLHGIDETWRGNPVALESSFASIANRTSFLFDFHGPSLAVDTMCSSSLSALHLACESLRRGESDVALAGGVNIMSHPNKYLLLARGRFLSKDGRCRSFGLGGSGYVPGEGVGVLVLKPLSRAQEDGDRIHGIVRASAINHGGRVQAYTVPSPNAQADVIRSAWERAGNASMLSYIEAHGTGTELGDPIEVRGLLKALGPGPLLPIGSVKSNIGHLESAAGVAAITKVLLQMRHGLLVPTLHTDELNPHIDFGQRLVVQRELAPWQPVGDRRVAGISSFGAGGSNAHVVLEEAPPSPRRTPETGAPRVIALSAKTPAALELKVQALREFLGGEGAEERLDDVAFTLARGREVFGHRAAFVARSMAGLRDSLGAWLREPSARARAGRGENDGLDAFADAFVRGESVQLTSLTPEARLTSLPTYPFRKDRVGLPRPTGPGTPRVPPKRSRLEGIHAFAPAWSQDERKPGEARGPLQFEGSPELREALVRRGANLQRGEGPGASVLEVSTPSVLEALPRLHERLARAPRSGMTWLLVVRGALSNVMAEALGAFAAVIRRERPTTDVRVLWDDSPASDATAGYVLHELSLPRPQTVLVRRTGGAASRREWKPFDLTKVEPATTSGGFVVMSGGLGRLGRLFAKQVLADGQSLLVLGRSSPDKVSRELEELPREHVLYRAVDVSDLAGVSSALEEARARFGIPRGVLHLAGGRDDGLFETKTPESWARALRPKLAGAETLDHATRNEPLEYFLCFSSIAASLPFAGQTDYAAANAALEAFVETRAAEVERGNRRGRSVAIGWPLFRRDVERVNGSAAGYRDWLMETFGLGLLEDEAAVAVLGAAIRGTTSSRFVVAVGRAEEIARALDNPFASAERSAVPTASSAPRAPDEKEEVAGVLRRFISEIQKIRPEDITRDTTFGELGFDSVSMKALSDRLNQHFSVETVPSLFYTHTTAEAVAQHLLDKGLVTRPAAPPPRIEAVAPRDERPTSGPGAPGALAIVGYAGRFPGSSDLDAFFNHIANGDDLIREIPPERWPLPAVQRGTDAEVSRWGGFVDGIDRFDFAFFKLSRREAELMDPQQRWLLELAYEALEDAGYAPSSLAGTSTGVFMGLQFHEYERRLLDVMHPYRTTGNAHTMGANRISFMFDLHGPSETIDTACSSSLVALHRASLALQNGECDVALVGAASLMLDPRTFTATAQMGILSPDGRCKAFAKGANGYVKGEGAAVLVLKTLERALRERDAIRAVVRATAVNHGGRASALTAPNPRAQAQLIQSAMRRANIDPRSIGYIEAHGTGTELGDPVEVEGLKLAFSELGRWAEGEKTCGIGSVKSNLGHLEPAAGMAGILKMVKALERRVLPRTIHADELNPYLQLDTSPFYIQRTTEEWKASRDAGGVELPRRAGVSSFGFGGVNAHVLLEEAPARRPEEDTPARASLVLLSQKTPQALARYAGRIARWIEQHPDARLRDIAFTLAQGRDHHACRAAFVAGSLEELHAQLKGFTPPPQSREPATGQLSATTLVDAVRREADGVARRVMLERLGELWSRGTELDVRALFADTRGERIPLPPYAFEPTTAWITAPHEPPPDGPRGTGQDSAMGELASCPLTPQAVIVRDHRIQARNRLPGVFSLAWWMTHQTGPARLSEAVFMRPVLIDQPLRLEFERSREGVLVGRTAEGTFFEARQVAPGGPDTVEAMPPPGLLVRSLGAAEVYERFARWGFEYGPTFRTISRISFGEDVAVTELESGAATPLDQLAGLLDGALQSLMVFGDEQPLVPFSVDRVSFLGPVQPQMRAIARKRSATGFDVALTLPDGTARILLRGVSFRAERPVRMSTFVTTFAESPADVSTPAERTTPGCALIAHTGRTPALVAALRREWSSSTIVEVTETDPVSLDTAVLQTPALDTLVFLGGYDPEGAELREDTTRLEQERGPLALFRLLKSLHRYGHRDRALRVFVPVTGAHAATPGTLVRPAACSVVALGQTLAKEHPTYRVSIVDVVPSPWASEAGNVARALVAEPAHPEGTPALLLDGKRLSRRIVERTLPTASRAPFIAGEVVVVVGGTGGLGLELTQRLVRAGVRVALLSRNEPSASVRARLREIDATETMTLHVRADVTRRASLDDALGKIRARFGAIHGAVHAALVLRDRTLANLDETAFREALEPKTLGTVNLLGALAREPVHTVLLFSGAQGVLADAGQANYAAGCAFKDGVAQRANTPQRRVLSVGWGYWGGVGIVAQPEIRERLARRGILSIEPEEGFATLERIADGPHAHVLAMRLTSDAARRLGFHLGAPSTAEPPASSDDFAEPFDALDALCGALLVERLVAAGMWNGTGWLRPVVSRHQRLAEALAPRLRTAAGAVPSLRATDLRARWPWLSPHVELVERVADAFPAVLAGERDALSVLFPEGSARLLEGVYGGNPAADALNERLAAEVVKLARGHAHPVRILELGAGTGATARVVLAAIERAGIQARYTFTDVSKAFLQRAERAFANTPAPMSFARLDLNQEPVDPALTPGEQDLVLATNVLHATTDVRRSLLRARALLGREGRLVLGEAVSPRLFLTAVFGLTDGWWPSDAARSPASPLLDEEAWLSLLGTSGFADARRVLATPLGGSQIFVAARAELSVNESPVLSLARTLATASPEAGQTRASAPQDPGRAVQRVTAHLRSVLGESLDLAADAFDTETTFDAYGIDSLLSIEILRPLRRIFGELPSTLLFEHNTLGRLAAHLALERPLPEALARLVSEEPKPEPQPPPPSAHAEAPAAREEAVAVRVASGQPATEHPGSQPLEIAIVGVACRLPGSSTPEELWAHLREGHDLVSEAPSSRWSPTEGMDPSGRTPGHRYVNRAGFLEDISSFDALFFQIPPAEAAIIDPQERLFLEVSWEALERAGVTRGAIAAADGRVGVFVGVMNHGYGWLGAEHALQGQPNNADSAHWSIANRLSYFLDARGPSLAVDTACSSSLTALHLACESLRRGECEMAVVGGVNLIIHPRQLSRLCSMRMLSPSGTSRPFGQGADGFVDGEGVVVTVLKPLRDALAAGDRILATIRGTAINAGGKTSGYSVPNPTAQGKVIAEALARASVDPETIGYVEAHGTGTELGDPIELRGLALGYARKQGPCWLGSLKSNVGHLESAAGLAGLLKVLLQLEHEEIAPTLRAHPPNPHLKLEETPFRLPGEPTPWVKPLSSGQPAPRRAGLSSFGAGGANAHVILEEPPRPDFSSSVSSREHVLITLSAESEEALVTHAHRLGCWLEGLEESQLMDVAGTLNTRRTPLTYRAAFVVSSMRELRERLLSFAARDVVTPERGLRDAPALTPGSFEHAGLKDCAAHFVRGGRVDLSRLHPRGQFRLLLPPTYPFTRRKHWLVPPARPLSVVPASGCGPALAKVDWVETSVRLQPPSRLFTEHIVDGVPSLPGAWLLACATETLGGLFATGHVGMRAWTWLRPIHEADTTGLVAEIRRTADDSASLEVRSTAGQVFARGTLEAGTPPTARPPRAPSRDGSPARAWVLGAEDIYRRFDGRRVRYGGSLRVLYKLEKVGAAVIGTLLVPADAPCPRTALLDGTLQALIGFEPDGHSTAVPFTAESLVFGAVASGELTVTAQRRTDGSFDATVVDGTGAVVLELHGLGVRNIAAPAPARPGPERTEEVLALFTRGTIDLDKATDLLNALAVTRGPGRTRTVEGT
ncbi:SDR family NAD(P)-dependent oxidoreductase [Archangium sp.]|uniref:SDR family NAD(P)-dependent oxidoreductase n=1 Tax=Archangium sp. TaxID=1872627 RepID=UPI0039C86552